MTEHVAAGMTSSYHDHVVSYECIQSAVWWSSLYTINDKWSSNCCCTGGWVKKGGGQAPGYLLAMDRACALAMALLCKR